MIGTGGQDCGGQLGNRKGGRDPEGPSGQLSRQMPQGARVARWMRDSTFRAFAITAGLTLYFDAGLQPARADGIDWSPAQSSILPTQPVQGPAAMTPMVDTDAVSNFQRRPPVPFAEGALAGVRGELDLLCGRSARRIEPSLSDTRTGDWTLPACRRRHVHDRCWISDRCFPALWCEPDDPGIQQRLGIHIAAQLLTLGNVATASGHAARANALGRHSKLYIESRDGFEIVDWIVLDQGNADLQRHRNVLR